MVHTGHRRIMTGLHHSPHRSLRVRWVPHTLVAGIWLAVLYALRFSWMEIPADRDVCLHDAFVIACRLRAAFGLLVHLQLPGIAAIALALGSPFCGTRWRYPCAIAAFALALVALVLYNASWGAPAAVIALLILADQGVFRNANAIGPQDPRAGMPH